MMVFGQCEYCDKEVVLQSGEWVDLNDEYAPEVCPTRYAEIVNKHGFEIQGIDQMAVHYVSIPEMRTREI